MPYYNKSKKKWVGEIRVNSQRIQKVFASKKEAKEWEASQKKSVSLQSSETHTVLLLDFATEYLDYSKAKHSQKTYKEKKASLQLLLQSFAPTTPVKEITAGLILNHLQRQVKKRSGYAANKDRKNLLAAWNWGAKYLEDFPAQNPCLVDRFPEERNPRYIPAEEDFWKVYACAESEADRVLLLAYLHLGARRNELFQLRWHDVDFERKRVRLYTRKRRDGSLHYDWLPLTHWLAEELEELKKQQTGEWVFPNPKTQSPYFERGKWLSRLCELAEVKHFGLHAIRHLTASILVKNNVSLIDIQTILRHKKISTTERYIHRLESVRTALNIFSDKKPS